MRLLKIEQIWFVGGWSAQAIFWTVAIIATLLLMILMVYSLFSEEQAPTQTSRFRLDARTVLLFFTAFGWSAAIASYFSNTFSALLLYGTLAGATLIALAGLPRYFAGKTDKRENTDTNTGRVLQFIPPNRAGIGKVYLSANRMPMELDAVTIGRELPVGAPVRIIEMLDECTAMVEPLENQMNLDARNQKPASPAASLQRPKDAKPR